MSDCSSGFRAGFSARHQGIADALQAAFAPPAGFAPADLRARAERGPVGFAKRSDGPKHFSPAEPGGAKPTAGWDPFDAQATPGPFVDPIAAAHATGYAEGLAAARDEAQATHERDTALLVKLAAALRSDDRIDRTAVAQALRRTVLLLVTRLVGDIGVSPEMLAARIDDAAETLIDSAESAMLRVHPDDVALLDGKLPRSMFAVGDASVVRGGFVLESASTIVEDGPDLWLEQLAQAIDTVAVPL